jgi:hypothetical protein
MTRKPTGKMPESKGILSDHKRDRKKLIAPFNYMLGGMQDISYIDAIMPEIVWLALLHEKFGLGEGAELARVLSKAAMESVVSEKKVFFGHISAYAGLSEDERKAVLVKLEGAGALERLRRVLHPLPTFYPECPMVFLFPDGVPDLPDRERELAELRRVLREMYDRTSPTAVFALATFTYLGFLGDALKVDMSVSLAKFPEIQKYPNTELSKRIASGLRVFAYAYFGMAAKEVPSTWPTHFWNIGLKLEKCDFGDNDD